MAEPSANGVVTSPSRHDVRAAGGTVSFTNNGSSAVQGVIVGDAPWITIPNPDLTLAAGETKQVQVSVDRSKRPGMSIGGSSGALDFRYAGGSAHTAIADTTESVSEPYSNAQLSPSPDLMMFSPGASRQPSSVSDFHISNRGNFHSDARVVFFPPDGSLGAGIDFFGPTRVEPYSSAYFPNIVKSVFGQSVERGSLLILGPFTTVAHTQVNTKGGVSTITALPILRSDEAHGAGGELFLTGVKKSATLSTMLHLQEMGGTSASVVIDFFDAEGRQVAATARRPFSGSRPSNCRTPCLRDDDGPREEQHRRSEDRRLRADSRQRDERRLHDRAVARGTGSLHFPAFPGDAPGREISISVANASPEPITISATKLRGNNATPLRAFIRAARSAAAGRRRHRNDSRLRLAKPHREQHRHRLRSRDGAGRAARDGDDEHAEKCRRPRRGPGTRGIGHRPRPGVGGDDQPRHRDLSRSRGLHRRHGRGRASAHVPREIRHRRNERAQHADQAHAAFTLPGGNAANNAAHSKDYLVLANGGFSLYPLAEELIGPGREALGDLHNAALDVEVGTPPTPEPSSRSCC